MRDSLISLDGTRPFIPSSSGFAKLPKGWKGSWPDDKASGVYSGGPYQWLDPHEYYKMAQNRPDWSFKDETGIPSQPPYNTLIKIIPDLIWDTSAPFPMNDSWGYHDAATGNGRYDNYYNDMLKRFGSPVSMEEFSDKMQLMNAMGYQAIFEAAQFRLKESGGVMLWKLNAAFPSVIWQIYDWYLMPNAGYYFMQKSCDPLHIQLNLNDSVATIVNRYHKPLTGLTADMAVYSLNSESLFQKTASLDLAAEDTKPVLSLAEILKPAKDIRFVLLKLKDNSGKEISRNTYWLDPKNNFKPLMEMPRTKVEATIIKRDPQTGWTIKISNPSDKVAFFVRLQLMQGKEEISPSLWSANYITLAPGESISVEVKIPARYSNPGPVVQVSGWNVDKMQLPTVK